MIEPAWEKEIIDVPGLESATQFGYSQCVRVGPFVYLAGQCGLGSDHEIVSDSFEEQALAAMDRVRHGIETAGGGIDDLVTMTVFITDKSYGRVFTSLRRKYIGTHFPASALVEVSSLMPEGAMIEIQAIGVLGSGTTAIQRINQ